MNANEVWVQVSANTRRSRKKIFGQIFEGECRLPVVVKFVRADGVKEIQILKKLTHRNVVRLIESGLPQNEISDHHYLALEKCHDKNLGQLVKSHRDNNYPFHLRYWWNMTEQIISGVDYIHGMKIIHKDLKPENILITPDEQTIKIADFGISEELKAVDKTKSSIGEFGTAGYRPPESFESGTISLKSDIFSLGVVICFTLSYGSNPFGDDDTKLDHNIKNSIVVFPKLFVENNVTTEHLIRCMIESELDDRPTIGEVLKHPCWTGREAKCNFDYRCSGKCKTPKDNIGKTPKIFKMGPDKDLYEMKCKSKNSHLNSETKVSSPKGSFKETSTASTPSTYATSTSHRNEDTTAGNAASSSKGATQAISQLEGDFPLQSSDDRTTHEAVASNFPGSGTNTANIRDNANLKVREENNRPKFPSQRVSVGFRRNAQVFNFFGSVENADIDQRWYGDHNNEDSYERPFRQSNDDLTFEEKERALKKMEEKLEVRTKLSMLRLKEISGRVKEETEEQQKGTEPDPGINDSANQPEADVTDADLIWEEVDRALKKMEEKLEVRTKLSMLRLKERRAKERLEELRKGTKPDPGVNYSAKWPEANVTQDEATMENSQTGTTTSVSTDREHPQSSNAGQTYNIYAAGDTIIGGSQHHIDRSQRPQSSNTE